MAAKTTKTALNSNGSPAQYSQPSRKGKKAWRKNVDIGEVEAGLEEVRSEERVTGSSIRSKTNDQLFQFDARGDDKGELRKSFPKFSSIQLSYNKSLAQRSAVPAVFSRPNGPSSASKKRPLVTHEDKTRLLRIGKRKRLGPLNSVVDPTELGHGSALLEPSHAVKESGTYDVWGAGNGEEEEVSEEKKDFLLPLVRKAPIKVPQTPNARAAINVPAIAAPHQGTSYNPPVHAHQELLRVAHERAEKEEKTREKYAGVKEALDVARKLQTQETRPGVPTGMKVDEEEKVENEEDDGAEECAELPPKRVPARKTKQQRRKALQLRAEKRALAERAAKKRFLTTLSTAKSIRSSLEKSLSAREQVRLQRKLVLQEKLKRTGLAGRRLGKHVVPEGAPDVQLGEELSESLRGLKVEGNLFRDRFLSLQHRALIEPRVPVLPKKTKKNTKEVEKHAWKNFDRE